MIRRKAKVLKRIRDYFDSTGAVEVLTDILQEYPNLDSNIYPLSLKITTSGGEEKDVFLHTSPELQMKKLLAKYKTDIYQITKVFRNFEGSKKHTIEFTMLEWYRVGYNLEDLIDDTQNIFIEAAIAVNKIPKISFNGKTFDFRQVEKITVNEAFYKYAGVYPDDYEKMIQLIKSNEKGIKELSYEEAFYYIYAFYVEPNLGKEKLTFIYDYPPQFAAMAKIENGRGKRFEAYVDGLELVNVYYELNDPQEQLKRLEEDALKKKKETGRKYHIDLEFIESLKFMPEASGASLGIDRLFMVLFDKKDIKQVQN